MIACIHLQPLPGAPRYQGGIAQIYETALAEAEIYARQGVDGLIVENFRDAPFYPERVPVETVAAMSAVIREIVRSTDLPVGVNVLRNDASAALAIATAAGAHFIRVNVHLGAVVADQGLIQGRAHETLRLRSQLHSRVLIFADAGVKHAAPLAPRGLAAEALELAERGKVDALIVSGAFTGAATSTADLDSVGAVTDLPVLVGSGTTPQTLPGLYARSQGLIVGSYFKQGGQAENPLEESRVQELMQQLQSLRTS
ncbi:MAG: BtpA/SgcQ family protein [Candidatus Sericytochromatia bacterium]